MTISDKEYFDAKFEAVDAKLVAIDAKFDAKFDQQRAELHAMIAQTVKWVAAVSASSLVIFITVIAFLFNVTTPKAAMPTAATLPAPTPVVIVVPGSGGEPVKVLPR
ncbi:MULTISPECIES: hypothetical protein [unclassified Massilia]|uniref:hypothetical protein n=1 Tax=unclassified Massilia TaxID=2609279 RepID=UPI001593322B|nr:MULTISPECIES: hypothetical protein [unclassified Massilia]NVD97385.1 hypothetical protein [Massilia sp. BJB1822]UTY59991.1 hypothetical protein HPQ68_24055 [Massilia sp. erpn]